MSLESLAKSPISFEEVKEAIGDNELIFWQHQEPWEQEEYHYLLVGRRLSTPGCSEQNSPLLMIRLRYDDMGDVNQWRIAFTESHDFDPEEEGAIEGGITMSILTSIHHSLREVCEHCTLDQSNQEGHPFVIPGNREFFERLAEYDKETESGMTDWFFNNEVDLHPSLPFAEIAAEIKAPWDDAINFIISSALIKQS